MTQTTRPATMSRPTDPQALGLRNILTDLLPSDVHATGGPERYTVSAVFTRRPSPGEIEGINGAEARAWLDRAQFSHVTVKVSDRRLEIANTNLDELSGGLNAVLAGLLARVSATDATRTHLVADELVDYEQREETRWEAVHALVERIPLGTPDVSQGAPGLGLARIVAELLPSTLGTDFASRRYPVVAEFTRPPTRTELAMIDGPLTRQRLDEAGYTESGLKVRDRHLDILNTNLDELIDGLAEAVAALLAGISRAAIAQDAEVAAEAARLAQQEDERARYVATTAAAITFVAPAAPEQATPAEDDAVLSTDRAELGEWEDEGGSASPR